MFTLNRITLAGAALLLAAIGCASGGAAESPGKPAADIGEAASSVETLPTGDPSAGEALFSGAKPDNDGDELNCHACHSLDGSSGVGPSLKDIVNHVPEGYATARAYLYESILKPGAYVREGFNGDIMPGSFGKKLDDQSLADLIAFLEQQ